MKIYTRMGDGGETSLPGGRRLPKGDRIFDCLGNLDETNAAIGLAASYIVCNTAYKAFPVSQLHQIQSNLLSIGAYLASDQNGEAKLLKTLDKETDRLEAQIDDWDKKMPPLKNFILPGGAEAASALHLCRTLIRRTERSYHVIGDHAGRPIPIARYLNRLSDYFFQAARFCNRLANSPDQIWRS